MFLNRSRYFIIFTCLTGCFLTSSGCAADTTNNQTGLNSQEVKEDYRAFLQQLKQLNSQYKQITGEITTVMKEEGIPKWDMGESEKQIDELFPKEATPVSSEAGMSIKETDKDLAVSVDLPGIQRDSLKVAVKDGKTLSISAIRKIDDRDVSVQKSILLPSAVDPKTAKAGYQDGVLTVKIVKISSQEYTIPVK